MFYIPTLDCANVIREHRCYIHITYIYIIQYIRTFTNIYAVIYIYICYMTLY